MAHESVLQSLSRRQGEILEIIYRLNEASVAQIITNLVDPPTDGAVRRMLNILQEKGLVEAREEGTRKIYRPRVQKEEERRRVLERVAETFFGGSQVRMMASLFETSAIHLSHQEKQSLRELIEKARRREEVTGDK